MADTKAMRADKRNMTSFATTGKTFDPLEHDENVIRKGERSNTLPSGALKRGDYVMKDDDVKVLKEKQQTLKGRVRRGSIFLGSVAERDLESFWKSMPDELTMHNHGYLSSATNDNVPGADRDPIFCQGTKDRDELRDKYNWVYSCSKGAKGYNDTSPNQDNFSYTIFRGWHITIVMDGHGPRGHQVSTRCVETIPYYMAKSAYFPTDMDRLDDMKQCLKEAFDMASKDLLGWAIEKEIDVQASGSTCVLFMHKEGVYFTANVGDSRAVIGYEDGKDVIFETLDHKPLVEGEKERIEANGGEIRTLRYDDFTVDRIFVKDCDYPGLCMSRSFGDECVKAHGVTSEPEVMGPLRIDLKRNPFMVIASDGVWEFIDSVWCIKAIVKKLHTEATEKIVGKLAKESRRRWKQEEGEYCDDITIAIQQLANCPGK